ncbi:MAG: ribose-phosphate pyrophosphokinase [Bacteroidetes bacterium]|nr:ribose-phosphate pyrophosphokinase [Bacteroidota bacterium]
MVQDLKIASGRSNLPLATKIAKNLDIELTPTSIRNFSDGEIWVKFEENIRGIDVFIIQSTISPSDNIMELLMLIDAARRASAKRITVVIPYFGYARQDRKDQPRVSLTAKLVANLIETAGADRMITVDLHSSQIQGFFDIPVDHLYASIVLMKELKYIDLEPLAVAAPDVGGVKTARSYNNKLGGSLVLVDKRRPEHNEAEITTIVGDVAGKNVLLVDDMIDTGSTFIKCAEALKERGAAKLYGVVVHPIFSGNALDMIEQSEGLDTLFITDTIPLKRKINKIKVVSVSDLIAEAIIRTYDNRSISTLFEIER